MKIAIVTPTFKRIEKLERLLKSLKQSIYKNFDHIIYCDNNDIETSRYFQDKFNSINIGWFVNNKQEFVIGSWNKAFKEFHNQYDAFLWLVDDTEIYPDTINELVKCFQLNFPDLDGIVGLKQICPGHLGYTFKWYGQILIGKKFIERYKDVGYKVCCVDYQFMYQDEELYNHATSLAKFKICPTAIIKHYHPAFIKEEMDETHYLSRGTNKTRDTETYVKRKQRGLVWGNSWELVNEKN